MNIPFKNFLVELRSKWFGASQPLSASDHWLLGTIVDPLSGEKMSDARALQISTVFACIKVLSETISTLPLKWYKRIDEDRRVEHKEYPVAKLFKTPNRLQNKINFIETIIAMLCLRGNYYGGKNYNNGARLVEILPLKPDRVKIETINNIITYDYTDDIGKSKTYKPDQIWHIKGLSLDGIKGLSPIEYARKSLNLSQHAENHGINYYKNGARTSGVVKIPGKLKEGMKEKMIKDVSLGMTGENKFKIMVFDNGAEWKETGLSQEDSQYLETRIFSVEEICRFFRVPTIMVGHSNKSSTYASSEQFMLSFVKFTLAPWLARIEEAINYGLIFEEDWDTIYAEFSVDGLLRGDTESRHKSYSLGRQWGWLSVNDIRKKENMDPVEDGDIYLQPGNMTAAGNDPFDINKDKGDNDSLPDNDDKDGDDDAKKSKKKKRK